MTKLLSKKYRKYIAIFVLGIASVVLLALALPRLSFSRSPETPSQPDEILTIIDPDIPESVLPCLPSKTKELKLEATVEHQKAQYYMLGAYAKEAAPHDLDYWSPLISVSQGECTILNGEIEDRHKSHRQFTDIEVSQQLALQQLKIVIEKEGIESIQKSLLADTSTSYLSTDYAWAYEQLGIELPEHIKVVDTFPTADDLDHSKETIFHSD